ncbi:MAG: ABC transporter permease [Spirochaetes bacterium]|jgi:simple sugar transport system permease protein|nr:ABC transporter permease [Spirochaetota bacterium]
MNEVFNVSVLTGMLSTMLTLATPLLFAALGETFSQNSGVLNLGVDGIMLLAAFGAFYAVLTTASLWLGVLVAMIIGLVMGLMMSFVSVTLKAEQGVSGIGLQMFGLGMSSLLFKQLVGTVQTVRGFPRLQIPLLGEIPILGPILFNNTILVYIAFALVPVSWWILERTTIGLTIKSVGQNPAAADSRGVPVNLVRYMSVCLGAVLAGLAGASLSISVTNLFQDNLTAGQGFIAVALVYFGGWTPVGVMLGALLFSVANSIQLWLQVLGVNVPASLANMLPYILTIVALTVTVYRGRKPAALNKPFLRGEN